MWTYGLKGNHSPEEKEAATALFHLLSARLANRNVSYTTFPPLHLIKRHQQKKKQ
jgi:hypothetical protein